MAHEQNFHTLLNESNYLKIIRSKQSRTFITVVKKLKHDVWKYNSSKTLTNLTFTCNVLFSLRCIIIDKKQFMNRNEKNDRILQWCIKVKTIKLKQDLLQRKIFTIRIIKEKEPCFSVTRI